MPVTKGSHSGIWSVDEENMRLQRHEVVEGRKPSSQAEMGYLPLERKQDGLQKLQDARQKVQDAREEGIIVRDRRLGEFATDLKKREERLDVREVVVLKEEREVAAQKKAISKKAAELETREHAVLKAEEKIAIREGKVAKAEKKIAQLTQNVTVEKELAARVRADACCQTQGLLKEVEQLKEDVEVAEFKADGLEYAVGKGKMLGWLGLGAMMFGGQGEAKKMNEDGKFDDDGGEEFVVV